MSWIGLIAMFIGKLLAQLIPALGAELRKNDTVQQVGADDDTHTDISDHISSGVDVNGVRMDAPGDSGTP